jgi:hypothetical protein
MLFLMNIAFILLEVKKNSHENGWLELAAAGLAVLVGIAKLIMKIKDND